MTELLRTQSKAFRHWSSDHCSWSRAWSDRMLSPYAQLINQIRNSAGSCLGLTRSLHTFKTESEHLQVVGTTRHNLMMFSPRIMPYSIACALPLFQELQPPLKHGLLTYIPRRKNDAYTVSSLQWGWHILTLMSWTLLHSWFPNCQTH